MQIQEVSDNFCVLSLDGGGSRGYLSIRYLENLETHLNRSTGRTVSLGERFDFIVGTSTGGIIALGLAVGISAGKIRELHETYLPKIFGPKARHLLPWWRPKYDNRILRDFLIECFGRRCLADLNTDACIIGVGLQNAQSRLFKTDYLARNSGRLQERLVDVALCTSAAPTYFASHSSQHSSYIVDGGLCANNPSMIALVEALQFERKSKRGRNPEHSLNTASGTRLRMLSVGTGIPHAVSYDYRTLINTGGKGWTRKFSSPPFFEITMQSQSTLVHDQAQLLLKQNYMRFNPRLNFSMALDDVSQLKALDNLSDLTEEDVEFAANLD
ncbi:MAG: CBASS cGAMP-activated phospholipase [Gammaproteobacteria bacterium]